jgi:rhodanese-related sulfurtransferase
VAVICATGARSRSAAALLSQKGFATVYNITGGTLGWQQAGLGVERD